MNETTAELVKNKNLADMLDFENQIFLDVLHRDGLVVAAKGLSMDVVLINIFRVYSDPGNLVLVLNCTEFEEKYFIEKCKDENIRSYNAYTMEKEDVYLSGGILFVTTRILVVDMLKDRVPIDKITGVIVLRAHTVLESCQEAFALRLYRQRNKIGFIKAFSNSSQSFTIGFNHIERIMRCLFVNELYIWPRFHATVMQSFKEFRPHIVELHIPTSPVMLKLQTCLLDIMNLTVKELKRINKTVELQEISVENCIMKNFHKMLQYQLENVWHQLSRKSMQLLTDLKTLQHLIVLLLYSDPVTFYSTLMEYRSREYAQTATWVLLPPAEMLFQEANKLVFNKDKELRLEFCPKWNVLSDILKTEIPADIAELKSSDNKVLILCQDRKSCYHLKKFLIQGPHHSLFLSALKNGIKFTAIDKTFKRCQYLTGPITTEEVQLKQSSTKKGGRNKEDEEKMEKTSDKHEDEEEELKDQYVLSMTQTKENEDSIGNYTFELFEQIGNMNLTEIGDLNELTVLIRSFKCDNYLSIQKVLEELRPNYMILYHSNITVMRQIELYEARRIKDRPLKIYYLVYGGTVEEQNYLTSLRREKEAFELLIETRSTMAMVENQDGKAGEIENSESSLDASSTRQGGRAIITMEKQFVIVDMREFRSELPALLHKRGIDIKPVTITVGDYILTPDICVERKSLSDLVGSLNSGRLYQQCMQMNRYYSKPMLLIEFDQNKPFSWQGNFMISNDSNSSDIQQKLILLTLHFPKLRIIWSSSPYASAQLFEELKHNKEQPNIDSATAIGNEEDLDVLQRKYNINIYDFLRKVPGITSKNIDNFLRNVKNLDEATKMSEEELKNILGNAVDAKAFHSILQMEHIANEDKNLNKRKLSRFDPK